MATETKCALTPEQQAAVVNAAKKIVHLGEDAGIRFAVGKDDYSPREYANRLFTILGMDVSFESAKKPAPKRARGSR